MEKENLRLELQIIQIRQKLNAIKEQNPYHFFKLKSFIQLQREFELKLNLQEKKDMVKYNLNIDDKYKDILPRSILNRRFFNALGIEEKNFIIENEYNFIEDKLDFFTDNPKEHELSEIWIELREKRQNMNNYDFYKNRRWK